VLVEVEVPGGVVLEEGGGCPCCRSCCVPLLLPLLPRTWLLLWLPRTRGPRAAAATSTSTPSRRPSGGC